MATNPTTVSAPHLRALIATGSMVILLALFGWLGYWYGNRNATDGTGQTQLNKNGNPVTTGSATADEPANKVVVIGKITNILNDTLEISTNTGDGTQKVEVKVASKTPVRKLDLRTIPKNGIGDGTPMQYADLKTGDSVVVTSLDSSATKINATKVSKVIYP